jgi:pantothenate kinase
MPTGFAGLDCGSTLMKAVWQTPGREFRYRTTRANEPLLTWAEMKADGVKCIRLVGIGNPDVPVHGGFVFIEPEQNVVEDEFRLQAKGVRVLIRRAGWPAGGFYLVSLGTGVSFTICRPDGSYTKCPLGHAFGGGYLDGMARLLGITREELFSDLPFSGCPPNILVKDVLPQTCGHWIGDLVQSHFGLAQKGMPKADIIAGLLETVAVETTSHLFQIGLSAAADSRFADIVFVGTLSRNRYLQRRLEFWMDKLDCTPHFYNLGEYAAALGAYVEIAAPGEEP